jgi:hypothetical protein
LRTPGQALGQCSDAFQLKRSDLTGVTTPPTPPGQALYAFVIADADGTPQDPAGDSTVGCFSNCGRYEFPNAPAADCSDTNADSACFLHQAFCLYLPADAGVYGKSCQTEADCYYNGVNYGIACWDNGNGKPVCSGRGFIKNASCDPSVCTFQYGYQGSKAWQPPYAQCASVNLRDPLRGDKRNAARPAAGTALERWVSTPAPGVRRAWPRADGFEPAVGQFFSVQMSYISARWRGSFSPRISARV